MTNIICVFLLLASSLSIVAQNINLGESTTLRYSGKVGVASWYFPQTPPIATMPENVNTISGQLDLTLLFDAPIEIRVNQRFQYDPDDENRNRYEIEDLYLDWFGDLFEIRAGYQIFSWETVESVKHADFLNQTDLESDFLDADKLSELAVRLRFIPPTDVEQVFEIYYIPMMRTTRFAVESNRYSFGLPISNDTETHLYQDDNEEWRPQVAISYQRPVLENIDTRFFYFNGYNRFPGIQQEPGQQFVPNFYHEYRPVHKAGLTFQGDVGSWLLKGEAVYTKYMNEVINQLGQAIVPEYVAYTTGFEYTLYSPIIDNHDLGTILELIGDTDSGKAFEELESFRPFRNHLFGGLRYTFNNVGDRSILAGAFLDYKEGDSFYRIEYEERVFERFKIKLSYNGLSASTSPLDQFEHTERIVGEIFLNF